MTDWTKVQYNKEELLVAIQNSEDLNHDEKSSNEKWIESFKEIGPNFDDAFGKAVSLIFNNGKH
ncbi:MAG: hypothetical protein O9264_08845 [Leptospira sp.]|nr:hypothetical protein [Leptospira sp.]